MSETNSIYNPFNTILSMDLLWRIPVLPRLFHHGLKLVLFWCICICQICHLGVKGHIVCRIVTTHPMPPIWDKSQSWKGQTVYWLNTFYLSSVMELSLRECVYLYTNNLKITKGLFTWRWRIPGRWGNSNLLVLIISYFNFITFTG